MCNGLLEWILVANCCNCSDVVIVLRRSKAEATSSEQTKLKTEAVFEPKSVSMEAVASSL